MWYMPWTLYGLCLCGLCIWTLYVTFIYTSNEAFFFLRRKISMQATLQHLDSGDVECDYDTDSDDEDDLECDEDDFD